MKRIYFIVLTCFLTACGGGSSSSDSSSNSSNSETGPEFDSSTYDARNYQINNVDDTSLEGTWLLASSIEFTGKQDIGGVEYRVNGISKLRATYSIVKKGDNQYQIFACTEAITDTKPVITVRDQHLAVVDTYNKVSYEFIIDSNTQMTATEKSILANSDDKSTITKSILTNAVKILDKPFADIGDLDISIKNSSNTAIDFDESYDIECIWEEKYRLTDLVPTSSGKDPGKDYKHSAESFEMLTKDSQKKIHFDLYNSNIFGKKESEIESHTFITPPFNTAPTSPIKVNFKNETNDSLHQFNYLRDGFNTNSKYRVNDQDRQVILKGQYIWE